MIEYHDTPADPADYLPPRPVMHEAEERALDIRARMHQDMHTTVITQFSGEDESLDELVDALCEDAMFQVEHLLVEIEALHIERRARSSVTEQEGA
jgi:hypothetical protein